MVSGPSAVGPLLVAPCPGADGSMVNVCVEARFCWMVPVATDPPATPLWMVFAVKVTTADPLLNMGVA